MVAQWKLTTKQQQRFDTNLDIKKGMRNISIAVNFNFSHHNIFFLFLLCVNFVVASTIHDHKRK